MPKSSNNKRFNLVGGGVKASHSNNFCDFASRHSEQITPEDLTKNFVILNLFQNLKIFGLFHVVSESINLINQNDISNVTRHSERSEESPELSNFVCNPEFLNCHCEKISDFRNNPIKSTANDFEPMGLLRRFAPHNDKLNNNYFVPLTCHPEFISGSINLISSTRAGVITKLIDPESSSG